MRIRKRWKKSIDWLKGVYRVSIVLPWLKLRKKPISDPSRFARRVLFIERNEYSQNGEDGIIEAIFSQIGTTNRYFVEFGAEDGMQCNSRWLLRHGWTGLQMDGASPKPGSSIKQEFITAENINQLFAKYGVPKEFDLLSIDIDGNDYWVWKAIEGYRPRVVVIEYNACFPAEVSQTIPYKADFVWDKTDYYGVTLLALQKLGTQKGYTLIGTDPHGVNAFFVLDELVPGHFDPPPFGELYRPAAFKGIPGKKHPRDPRGRDWVTV
jgi:hypothetical protein